MKAVMFCVWIVSAMIVINLCFSMMTEADTLFNCIGFILSAVFAVVSIKTRCFILFTSIFKKKNEKKS